MKNKTLACVANSPLIECGGFYYYMTGEWSYIEAVSAAFGLAHIYANIFDPSDLPESEIKKFSYRLEIENCVVHAMRRRRIRRGNPFGVVKGMLQPPPQFLEDCGSWDYGFLMAPSWPAWHASRILKKTKKYAVCFRGDWRGVATSEMPPIARKLRIDSLVSFLVGRVQDQMMREASVRSSEGYVLADRYPDFGSTILPTMTMELPEDIFREKEDTCTGKTIRLLFVGSLHKRKAVQYLIRAIALLPNCVELDIVGDGPEKTALVELADELAVSDRCHFIGYLPHGASIYDIYHDADIFVLPSLSEGFPRVVWEAFSQSLPVALTPVGGVPCLLKDAETARFLELHSEESIAKVVMEIIDDPTGRKRMIQSAFKLALEKSREDQKTVIVEAIRTDMNSV